MSKLRIWLKKINLDLLFAGIAGALIFLVFRNRFEVCIYRFMLMFSPIIPDIFISLTYLDAVCALAGGISGLCIYTVWNKKNKNMLKWLPAVLFIGLILINTTFYIEATYISKQLKKPLEELSIDSRFYPTKIDISFDTFVYGLMVRNGDTSTGRGRALRVEENSPAMKYIYEGIQSLSNSVFYDSDYSSLYNTVRINYDNNKRYKTIWIDVDETYSYQRINGMSGRIGTVRHNSETLHGRIDEVVKEIKDFNENKKEYFTAQWFNAENAGDVRYKDISKKDLLFDAMSSSQNYNTDNEENDYYSNFFIRKPITAEDEDLIAMVYTFDTEDYVYEDVALYDRTKKLLIFKDENNEMKFVEKDINSIFE